jgi:hypothetical protein
MSDFVRDRGVGEGPTAEANATSEYRIREVEARLDRRIEAVESRSGRTGWTTRFAAAGFVVSLAALAIVLWKVAPRGGDRTVNTLSAKEIVLRDADGVERGRLATASDGSARLSLSDREGHERIRLTVLADGSPGVTISDPDSRPRAVLGYLPDGTTNLVFADSGGTSRAVFGLEPDGSAQAVFADPSGTIRTVVGVGADGTPTMSTIEGKTEDGSHRP